MYDPTFVPPPPRARPVGPDRVPSTAVPGRDDGAPAEAQNAMATTSLVFGLCSILIPILAIPGVILGVVCLRRLRRLQRPLSPSAGRARAVAGITTSLLFGTVSLVVLIVIAGG
jgi:hypothetical protein